MLLSDVNQNTVQDEIKRQISDLNHFIKLCLACIGILLLLELFLVVLSELGETRLRLLLYYVSLYFRIIPTVSQIK
jgi:hypothetical protein